MRFDIQTELSGANEANFCSFLCLFVFLQRSTESLNPRPSTRLQICPSESPREIISHLLLLHFWTQISFTAIRPLFSCLFPFNGPRLVLPGVWWCVLLRLCQEVRYDCIIRYRSLAPPTCSTASYWFLQLVQEAWNWSSQWIPPAQCFYLSRKHSCTAQPCQQRPSVCLLVSCSAEFLEVLLRRHYHKKKAFHCSKNIFFFNLINTFLR